MHMLQKSYSLSVEELPGLYEAYPSLNDNHKTLPKFTPYPSSGREVGPDELVFYLHSSGSTGFPKPIPKTQKISTQWMGAALQGASRRSRMRWASFSVPTFHALGHCMHIDVPLCSGEPVAIFGPQYPAPPVIPTGQNMLEAAKVTGCNAMAIVPSFVEVWAQSEETVKYLTSLSVVGYGGGPLSKATGDKLVAAGVNLVSIYGGTEFGAPHPILDEKAEEDWEYISFSPFSKPEWVTQGDGTFELHFLTCETHQPSVENLTDGKGYNTSDLFLPHPTKPDLWKIVGRTDDVITLSTAEKIVPIPQEGYLHAVPMIAGAIMFGRGRSQPGLLIESREKHAIDPKDLRALAEFRNKIWPYVEETNKLGPTFARIFKETILVSDPAKPFPRASKGTIMRKMVLALYADEIDSLYEDVQASTDSSGIAAPESWTAEIIEDWLFRHATAINEGREHMSSVDLFQQGFDSLSATYLRNRILGALRSSDDPSIRDVAHEVPEDIVFVNPTIQWLASAVAGLVNRDTVHQSKSVEGQIEDLIAKYSANLPNLTGKSPINASNGLVVVLTGSTGNLGSHLLADLLATKQVVKIYTLDRASAVAERQALSFQDRKLPTGLLANGKLVALTISHARADLGLSSEILEEIKRTATHFIHNAWKLDFNQSVSSFESNIASARSLIDICASCANTVKFLFTSSIASVGNWDPTTGAVPEEILNDIKSIGMSGYGASKYVVERIASKNGLPVTSLRLGQICGAVATGAWNTTDWVPIIVKSSVKMGCLPTLDGDVSWMLMDTVCHTLTDMLLSPTHENWPKVVNVVHPHPVPWNEIFGGINDALSARLPLVPFHEWLAKVESLSANATEVDLDQVPAIKLLSFFCPYAVASSSKAESAGVRYMAGGSPDYVTVKAEHLSPSLKNAPPLGREDAAMWVKYWRQKGMLL